MGGVEKEMQSNARKMVYSVPQRVACAAVGPSIQGTVKTISNKENNSIDNFSIHCYLYESVLLLTSCKTSNVCKKLQRVAAYNGGAWER